MKSAYSSFVHSYCTNSSESLVSSSAVYYTSGFILENSLLYACQHGHIHLMVPSMALYGSYLGILVPNGPHMHGHAGTAASLRNLYPTLLHQPPFNSCNSSSPVYFPLSSPFNRISFFTRHLWTTLLT